MASKRKHTGSKALGAELRRRRGDRTLSQVSDLSKDSPLAGSVDSIGVSTLYMIEEGQTMPTLRSLQTLATLYRVPLERLVSVLSLERSEAACDVAAKGESMGDFTLEALAAKDWAAAYSGASAWCSSAREPAERISADLARAKALWKLGHQDQATLAYFELMADEQLPESRALAALSALAELFKEKGHLKQALIQANAGLALADDDGQELTRASLLRLRANILVDELRARPAPRAGSATGEPLPDELQTALDDLKRSTELFKGLGFSLEVAFNAVLVGRIHCQVRDFGEGVERMSLALSEFRRRRHSLGEATALTEMARAYYSRQLDDEARKLFWKSERIAGPATFPDLAFMDYFYLMRLEERSDGNPAFFYKKCQRLHPVVGERTPELTAFEELCASYS